MTNSIKAIEIKKEYSNGSKFVVIEQNCDRCHGAGNFPHMQHIDGGTCYKCEGTGVTCKTIKTKNDDVVVLVNVTTTVKPVIKEVKNDNEAMRNAMLDINADRKAKRAEIERVKEEDKIRRWEMENLPRDTFEWDDED